MIQYQLRDGSKTTDLRLDRLVQFDEKSREFPIRELNEGRKPRSYTWRCPSVLDQGPDGACVGFAWAHELLARPAEAQGVGYPFAMRLYREAQKVDPWPGEAYEGTSVLAGAKAVYGLVDKGEYRWAFSPDDALIAIGHTGPVVLGVNWYESMFNPDSKGFLRVAGRVAGGHAIVARAVNWREERVLLHNSWGPTWGGVADAPDGCAWISFADLARLLGESGECCVPLIRSEVKVAA